MTECEGVRGWVRGGEGESVACARARGCAGGWVDEIEWVIWCRRWCAGPKLSKASVCVCVCARARACGRACLNYVCAG